MRQSVASAGLQLTLSGKSGWCVRGSCCHSKGPWQAGEMGCDVRKFSRVLQLGKNNPMHQNMLRVNWLENYLAETALGLLVDPS